MKLVFLVVKFQNVPEGCEFAATAEMRIDLPDITEEGER